MGAVAHELEQTARQTGAEILTGVQLQTLDLTGTKRSVEFELDGKRHVVEAHFVLVNFGRNVLAQYAGSAHGPDATDEGSVFKINMLLRRLPKLKATRYPAPEAFCGTFHCDEGYEQMELSYRQALAGRLPERLPCEVY